MLNPPLPLLATTARPGAERDAAIPPGKPSQVAAGVALGIAAQALLVIVIIGYVMPFFGLELLGMARDLAAFNLPARVGQLFGSASSERLGFLIAEWPAALVARSRHPDPAPKPPVCSRAHGRTATLCAGQTVFNARRIRRRSVGWVIFHWFELGTLALLCLNLWFVSSVLNVLKETNRWLAFLTRVRWDEIHGPEGPIEGRPSSPS
jgi:hypothetical protein